MIQTITELITKHRGFFLFMGALFSRLFFVMLIYSTAYLATMINPQENYVYRRSEIFRGPTKDVIDLEFRADGQWLAAAAQDGSIFLWDFTQNFSSAEEQGRARMILPLQEGIPNDIVFTHDNRYLLSGGSDQKLRFWNVSSLSNKSIDEYVQYIQKVDQSEPFVKFEAINLHEAEILHLALSDDGRYLASADRSGTIYLYDFRFGDVAVMEQNAVKLKNHTVSITDIVFSSSSRWLAASDVSGRVSIWDLTLLDSNPQNFTTPARTIEAKTRVHDIEFDLAYKGPSLQPERFLFTAGSDNLIHAWSLTGQSDVSLPRVHKTAIVKIGVTRDNTLNEYWLISADQDGMLIFWELNKWDGFATAVQGDEFYIVDSPTSEITVLESSLKEDVPAGTNLTSRHLLAVGSTDRTVQVYIFGSPQGSWKSIILRPVSGAINDIAINPANTTIITAGRDNTVRMWDSARVTDVSFAFPAQQFLRFLIPILLALVLSVHTTSTFMMKTHNIIKRSNAIKYILNAIFGLNFKNPFLFALSLLVPIWNTVIIEHGKAMTDMDRFNSTDIIGGPGKVVVRPGNVVVFQTIRTKTAIITNNTYYLRPFERIRKVISLEDQFYEYSDIETYTRDGIKITLKNVRIRYRVRFINHEGIPGERIRSRYQNYPDPVDPESLDRALDMLYWSEAIQAVIRTKVIHFVNMRPLDYFTAPNSLKLNEAVRKEFQFNIDRLTQGLLSSFGAELLWMDVGVFDINPETVRKARLNLWSWRLRKDANALRARGYSQVEAYRELGRIRGEAEILKAIIEEIQRWDEQLRIPADSDKDAEKAAAEQLKRKRASFMSRMAELLRSYLRIASSERNPFGPWNNPTNPNNPYNQNDPNRRN